MPVGVVLWTDQVEELLFPWLTITKFAVLRIQLMPGEVLHDAGPQGVPQDVGGGSEAVPEKPERKTQQSC